MSASPSAAGRLPDFLIVGATKAGSTSVHRYLAAHPRAFMHPRKELRFFNDRFAWHRGPDWYRAQFAEAADALAVGEASNSYSRWPQHDHVPERIASLVPGMRLVYLVREPFARLESHYRWRLSTGYEVRPPAEALRADPSYVTASLYGSQVARYRERFDASRMLVLRSEALFDDPEPHLRRLCDHLRLPFDASVPFSHANPTTARQVMPPALRRPAHWLAWGPLRRPVRRLRAMTGAAPARLLGRPAGEIEFRLPDALRAELAARFAEDRRLLADLAGAEVARWSEPEGVG